MRRHPLRGAATAALILTSAPAGATDYSAPLSPAAAAFKARFAEREAACQQQSAQQLGLSLDKAAAFCACQSDVIARNSTADELDVLTKSTFGTKDERDANVAPALALITRLLPERKQRCGY